MARKLRRSVVVGGTLVPAGTAETPDLAKAVTNDAAWEGKAEKESKDSGEAKQSRSRKR